MEKHYVVILDWAYDGDYGVEVMGVKHTLEEAQEVVKTVVNREKDSVIEDNLFIYADSENEFDAGEDGYYATNHIRVYVSIV